MITENDIWEILKEVEDPEIPILSVVDMGVVRAVEIENNHITVTITPTYSGCPAMKTIETDIREILAEKKVGSYDVISRLSPPWTTDWMTEEGKKALLANGIAPPEGTADKGLLMGKVRNITCPKCKSTDTRLLSQFGTTACKALYVCNACKDPFDYFKCL